MARLVLDTTVLVDLLKDRPGAWRRFDQAELRGDDLWTTPISVEETVRGLRENEIAKARALIDGLLVASIDAAIAWQAGEWRRDYASRGITLKQADCLIAAAALACGGSLATGNPKDFPQPELRVEHWPVNETQ
jgi:predicted nucleic acid-binding protein